MTDHKIRIIFLMSSLNTKKNICMEKYAHCFSPNAQKLRLFSQVFHFHLKFVWISSSLKEKNSYRVILSSLKFSMDYPSGTPQQSQTAPTNLCSWTRKLPQTPRDIPLQHHCIALHCNHDDLVNDDDDVDGDVFPYFIIYIECSLR